MSLYKMSAYEEICHMRYVRGWWDPDPSPKRRLRVLISKGGSVLVSLQNRAPPRSTPHNSKDRRVGRPTKKNCGTGYPVLDPLWATYCGVGASKYLYYLLLLPDNAYSWTTYLFLYV